MTDFETKEFKGNFTTLNSDLKSLKIAKLFELITVNLSQQVVRLLQLEDAIKAAKAAVLPTVLNFDGFSDDEIAEIEKELAKPIPTKWVELFGDVLLRALFEGESQRFFAKAMIDQNGIDRPCIFYGRNKYLPCTPTLYLILDLPDYKQYQNDGGDYKPIIADYLPEHEDMLNEADRKLTKAIIAEWQQQIAQRKAPRILQQLSALTV